MNTLIVGGTSGLGLEMAQRFPNGDDDQVIVTGRHDPQVEGLHYEKFSLIEPKLSNLIGKFVMNLPQIDNLVYAAGYFQAGRVTDLDNADIEEMLNVGARGLIYFTKSILDKQDELSELITVTSTSQWVPRAEEPIYNFTKAGEAHFSNALSKDGRIGKTLVAAPSGMNTRFWEGVERDDLDQMLDPADVADAIMKVRGQDYVDGYKEIRILRQPFRVQEVIRGSDGQVTVEPLELK